MSTLCGGGGGDGPVQKRFSAWAFVGYGNQNFSTIHGCLCRVMRPLTTNWLSHQRKQSYSNRILCGCKWKNTTHVHTHRHTNDGNIVEKSWAMVEVVDVHLLSYAASPTHFSTPLIICPPLCIELCDHIFDYTFFERRTLHLLLLPELFFFFSLP